MKYRATYLERGREYSAVIDGESTAMVRARFAQAYPGSEIKRLEPINPPSAQPAANRHRAHDPLPLRPPMTDAELAQMRTENRRLKEALRAHIRALPAAPQPTTRQKMRV
jgi:hypothetical protein